MGYFEEGAHSVLDLRGPRRQRAAKVIAARVLQARRLSRMPNASIRFWLKSKPGSKANTPEGVSIITSPRPAAADAAAVAVAAAAKPAAPTRPAAPRYTACNQDMYSRPRIPPVCVDLHRGGVCGHPARMQTRNMIYSHLRRIYSRRKQTQTNRHAQPQPRTAAATATNTRVCMLCATV